jgi:integrase
MPKPKPKPKPKRRGNREGSITQRADGRWQGRVSLGDGRRKAVYGKTREAVAARVASLLVQVNSGGTTPSGKLTVEAWFLEWIESVKGTVKPRTWQRYSQLLTAHAIPALGKVALTRLSPERLERLYREKVEAGLSPRTVHHLHVVIGTALEKALKRRKVAQNTARLADPPRIGKYKPRALTPDECKALLEAAAGDKFEALYYLAVYTGARLGELLALSWDHVDPDAATIEITGTLQRHPGEGYAIEDTKTERSARTIRLAPAALKALQHHRVRQLAERLKVGRAWARSELVFTTEIGTPVEAPNLRRRSFWPILEKIGLATKITTTETERRNGRDVKVKRTTLQPLVRFHDLRHSTAMMLLKAGEPITIVSAMLGHARTSTTTDTYGHVLEAMTGSAAGRLQDLLGGDKPKRDGRTKLVSKLVSPRRR